MKNQIIDKTDLVILLMIGLGQHENNKISEAVSISRQMTTLRVDNLEKNGLVYRKEVKGERYRDSQYRLTQGGKSCLHEAQGWVNYRTGVAIQESEDTAEEV